MKSAGSDDNGLLTPSIFVESVKQQKNDPEYKELYRTLCYQYFEVLDVNGDGFLQEEEFARALDNAGFHDPDIAHRAFDEIDLNRDGKLSLEEFASGLVEYHTSDDESSRYRNIWGPLVE